MAFISIGAPGNPTIEVSFDYTHDPRSASFTWTDITPYLVSYSRAPVRTNEFDQPGPAPATLVLRNDDARFTPDNTSGPYYGGLKKYRRFRVRAQWSAVTYDRYWGYVLDWPQSWAQAGKDATVTLQLTDVLTALSTTDLVGTSPSEALSGEAIDNVLASTASSGGGTGTEGMGGPAILDDGATTIAAPGTLPAGSFALQRIKDIAATENGVVYGNRAGQIVFNDRHHRLTATRSLTSQATLGDQSGEVPYIDPTPMYGDVWTTVAITPLGGTMVSTTDDAAEDSYFNQTLNFPTAGQYLSSDATEATYATQYLVNRYSNPTTRVPSVTLIGARNPTMWPTILSLGTSDLVTFKRRPAGSSVISVEQFVEGFGEQVVIGRDWRVSLALSSVDPQSYWIAEDARLSLAGETTRGGY